MVTYCSSTTHNVNWLLIAQVQNTMQTAYLLTLYNTQCKMVTYCSSTTHNVNWLLISQVQHTMQTAYLLTLYNTQCKMVLITLVQHTMTM